MVSSVVLTVGCFTKTSETNEKEHHKLRHAAKNSNVELAKSVYKDTSLDVNAKDKDGFTQLHWAIAGKNVETVELLLKASNIQVNEKDNNGKTALDIAKEKSHSSCVTVLENAIQNRKT